ncbi:MAG: DEAD/DEAH box helicase family protein [Candidatus Scalindua sp.]|nr:DEAD/DEAH box helicase family protein [Candidatus Scalindua sp.]
MRIKSFVAFSVEEALSDIKKEMGETSIILETRNIGDDDIKAKPGQKLVEIVAAQISTGKENGKREERKENGCFNEEEHRFPLEQENSFSEVEWPQVCNELFSLLCEQQVERQNAKVLITEMMNELDGENLDSIDVQREKIKEIIIRKIKISRSNSLKDKTNKPMVFIGATGTGKTTVMSKLARKARLHSGNEILLISIENDCVETLNSVAMEIGAAVAVVATPQELMLVQDEFRRSTHLFIETPGTGGNDKRRLLALSEYTNAIPNSEIHLVLNATTRLKDITPLIVEQKLIPIHGLIFTKIDESDTFGSLLNVVMKSDIPVSYIAGGKRVSGDIKPATADRIAEMILG